MTLRAMVMGVLLATLLAACGSSSGGNGASSSEGKKYVAALMASYDKQEASGESQSPFSRSQVECFDSKIIDALGVDTLQKNDVTPADAAGDKGINSLGKKLSADQATKVSDAFFGGACFDAAKYLAEGFAAQMTGQPKGAGACFANGLVKLDAFRKGMTQAMLFDSSADPLAGVSKATINGIYAKCHIDASKLGG